MGQCSPLRSNPDAVHIDTEVVGGMMGLRVSLPPIQKRLRDTYFMDYPEAGDVLCNDEKFPSSTCARHV